jgi:hypothetical protein
MYIHHGVTVVVSSADTASMLDYESSVSTNNRKLRYGESPQCLLSQTYTYMYMFHGIDI